MNLFKNKKFNITNLSFIIVALMFILKPITVPLKEIFVKKPNEQIKEKTCYLRNDPPKTIISSFDPKTIWEEKISYGIEEPQKYNNPTDYLGTYIIGLSGTAVVVSPTEIEIPISPFFHS